MNITLDELRDKIEEQENTINKFQASIDTITKQHTELIKKLSLAVYNIDESIFNQIFTNQVDSSAIDKTIQ